MRVRVRARVRDTGITDDALGLLAVLVIEVEQQLLRRLTPQKPTKQIVFRVRVRVT